MMESAGDCRDTVTLPPAGEGATNTGRDVSLMCHPAAGRLAAVLLRHAARMSPARLSKNDMATNAGASRQEVAAALEAIRAAGIIRIERNRMTIADLGALRRLADCTTEGKDVV